MNKLISAVSVFAFTLLLPAVSFAQLSEDDATGGELGTFLENILAFIDGYVIPFILGIGFLLFVWGMFLYFIKGGHSDEAQETGKSLILYAIAGYVVIFAFWGLINILTDGLGLQGENLENTPGANLLN